eukprot:234903_1
MAALRMQTAIHLNSSISKTIHRYVSYSKCLYCFYSGPAFDLSKQMDRYNLLNASMDSIQLHKNWKLLHNSSQAPQYKYPLFGEYCKMIQMLSKFRKFSEISAIYEELLNHISLPPQYIAEWRDFDILSDPMNVAQLMRCAKIAKDWNTMYQFMQIYIKNKWKFNKISARFALECCWRHNHASAQDTHHLDIEQTVSYIWSNLITNDIPNEYCFIQLLLNINKTFTNKEHIEFFLLQILGDIHQYLSMHNHNKRCYLLMIIYDDMLQIAEKYNLNHIQIKIAQQILLQNQSNLFLSNFNVTEYVRYGRIPLRLIVKLLHFYDDTTNIEGALELFQIMKRFRSWSLQNINNHNTQNVDTNDGNAVHKTDFLLKYWDSEIFRDDVLPLFMKIIYDYFYSLCVHQTEIKQSLLIEYLDKAHHISKYINYNTDHTPAPSLYLCGIHYLSGNINTANKFTMNVMNTYFVRTPMHCSLLLKQWPNGQFVLNLAKSLNIPNVMYTPLIVSALIYYAKTIPKQDKTLRSIKIKLDIDELDEVYKVLEYLSTHFPPKIEYQMIGKIPNWMGVVELQLNSLLQWVECHNIICFQDIDKHKMLSQACYDLLPRIQAEKEIQSSAKQLFKDLNLTLRK